MATQLSWNFDAVYPCVGCGYCCRKVPCPIGVQVYGYKVIKQEFGHSFSPCSGLKFDNGRYWCKLVVDSPTEKDRLWIKDQLCIGSGCCSSLNSDRRKQIELCAGPRQSLPKQPSPKPTPKNTKQMYLFTTKKQESGKSTTRQHCEKNSEPVDE